MSPLFATLARWTLLVNLGLSSALGPLVAGAALAAPASPIPAPTNSGQALEISPPVIDLTVNPGQSIQQLIRIRDIASGPLIVTGQVNDFVAGGEDGQPKLLLNNTEPDPYSIQGWITNVPQLTLVPREIKAMNIVISVPAGASPGGHYGVLRFTATPPNLEGTGVSLSASLGSLVLLRVNGAITESLQVASFSVNKDGKTGSFFQSAPLDFVERLRNTGNVHLQPSGFVHITDMFGKPVANLGINQPPHNVLPASIRKFDEPLDSSVIGTKQLFGRYKATLDVTYGESKRHLAATMVFWVIPWGLILTILIIVVIAYLLLRWGLRRYNRYIIGQASGKRPPRRRR